jgi:hypothetical protein
MKSKILALFLLAGSTVFAGTHFSFGIGFGGGYYPPPPIVTYAPPPAPYAAYAPPPYYSRPGYSWVGGYWYPNGARYGWRPGYWARPPYARSSWVGPRYYGHRYYPGYWRR